MNFIFYIKKTFNFLVNKLIVSTIYRILLWAILIISFFKPYPINVYYNFVRKILSPPFSTEIIKIVSNLYKVTYSNE